MRRERKVERSGKRFDAVRTRRTRKEREKRWKRTNRMTAGERSWKP
jgi:hypothetical protein